LLQQEENRAEDLETRARDAIAAAWMAGTMFFRGRSMSPQEQGTAFAVALHAAATRVLPELFPHFVPTQVQPSELLQLIEAELSGPSPKFLAGDLGILELDSGRYVPACSGVLPRRIQEHIDSEGGLGGTTLLAHFGGPPYGYTANVVKACVAGLLRAGKVRLQPDGGNEITAVRDAGVRDLFHKDRGFRRATIFPAGEDDIGFQARARICKFFEGRLGHPMDREDHAIADAVAQHFPQLAQTLRSVHARLNRLPGSPEGPADFARLGAALEQCIRTCRQTKPTVKLVKKHLDTLRDGVGLLQIYDAELTAGAMSAVTGAHDVLAYQAAQLTELGIEASNVHASTTRVADQLGAARPWSDIGAIDDDLGEIRRCYAAERQRLLQWQEHKAEAARARVKGRDGFATLTGEQAHRVLRPLASAVTDTTAEAVAPALVALKDPFTLALGRAEDQANDLLDHILSEGEKPLITRVDLELRNREVASEAEVEALVDEIKQRLLEQVRTGARVRLV
jgi:hypothetical protein